MCVGLQGSLHILSYTGWRKATIFWIANPRETFPSKLSVHHSSSLRGNKADLYFVTRPRENKSICLVEGNNPNNVLGFPGYYKPFWPWIKHALHVLGPMRPREGCTYCFGCTRLRGVTPFFCGAIKLRETKQVAVLGRGLLVEMKPIFLDSKTKPKIRVMELRET